MTLARPRTVILTFWSATTKKERREIDALMEGMYYDDEVDD